MLQFNINVLRCDSGDSTLFLGVPQHTLMQWLSNVNFDGGLQRLVVFTGTKKVFGNFIPVLKIRF